MRLRAKNKEHGTKSKDQAFIVRDCQQNGDRSMGFLREWLRSRLKWHPYLAS